MANELKGVNVLNGKVGLTRYWGGVANGVCVQLSPPRVANSIGDYASLTREQTLELAIALIEAANGTREYEP
jgi:hypothetical protein